MAASAGSTVHVEPGRAARRDHRWQRLACSAWASCAARLCAGLAAAWLLSTAPLRLQAARTHSCACGARTGSRCSSLSWETCELPPDTPSVLHVAPSNCQQHRWFAVAYGHGPALCPHAWGCHDDHALPLAPSAQAFTQSCTASLRRALAASTGLPFVSCFGRTPEWQHPCLHYDTAAATSRPWTFTPASACCWPAASTRSSRSCGSRVSGRAPARLAAHALPCWPACHAGCCRGGLHARWLGRAEHLPAASAAPSAQLPDGLNAWLQATLAASQTGLGPRACCSATTWWRWPPSG